MDCNGSGCLLTVIDSDLWFRDFNEPAHLSKGTVWARHRWSMESSEISQLLCNLKALFRLAAVPNGFWIRPGPCKTLQSVYWCTIYVWINRPLWRQSDFSDIIASSTPIFTYFYYTPWIPTAINWHVQLHVPVVTLHQLYPPVVTRHQPSNCSPFSLVRAMRTLQPSSEGSTWSLRGHEPCSHPQMEKVNPYWFNGDLLSHLFGNDYI